jgi:hypothetical protein
MATIPQVEQNSCGNIEDPAGEMARLLEEHFDEMGWSEEERNDRVARAGAMVDAAVARARHSKSV